jgi:lysophospholipase L1-like esterase
MVAECRGSYKRVGHHGAGTSGYNSDRHLSRTAASGGPKEDEMSGRRGPISSGRKIVYAAATVVFFTLLLEGGARLALLALGPGDAPLRVGFRQETTPLFRPDPDLFFRLRPGLRIEQAKNTRMIDVRTNSLGLRGPELSVVKPERTFRVLAVGDSCTFGSGSRTDQTYPWKLQEILRAEHPELGVEVVNAGVPGYTSYQARRYLEVEGFRLAPDAVVIAVGFNDAATARPTGKRWFSHARFLSDVEYAAALRRQSRLAIVRLARRLRQDAGTDVTASRQAVGKIRVAAVEYRENLTVMIDACRSRGILPAVVVWPIATQAGLPRALEREGDVVANQRTAREVARDLAVPLVDLEPLMATRPELFLDEIHLKPEGYAAVARAVADELAAHLPVDP